MVRLALLLKLCDLLFCSIITPTDSDGCASRKLNDSLDLIFTDIIGVEKLRDASGAHQSRYRLDTLRLRRFLFDFKCLDYRR